MHVFIDSLFQGQDRMERANSKQYDGLNMDDRGETTIDPGVYCDLQRNTPGTTGKIFNDILLPPGDYQMYVST